MRNCGEKQRQDGGDCRRGWILEDAKLAEAPIDPVVDASEDRRDHDGEEAGLGWLAHGNESIGRG